MAEPELLSISLEEQRLLWAAIVSVSLQYHLSTADEKEKRPQQGYEPHDGKRIGNLIKEIRRQYDCDRLDRGKTPNFQAIKAKVLQQEMNAGLSLEKRNFYSSVIASFFSWRHHGTPHKRDELAAMIAALPPPPKAP